MWNNIRVYLASVLAPGVEESKNDQIKLIIDRNLSFKVDMESFRDSTEVKRQLRLSAEEKRA
jgi:hypothetical protein|tara:strand:- start:3108 stop:3293 length:186 start_codon:yes stop_codon:yes gene_type:complete